MLQSLGLGKRPLLVGQWNMGDGLVVVGFGGVGLEVMGSIEQPAISGHSHL